MLHQKSIELPTTLCSGREVRVLVHLGTAVGCKLEVKPQLVAGNLAKWVGPRGEALKLRGHKVPRGRWGVWLHQEDVHCGAAWFGSNVIGSARSDA